MSLFHSWRINFPFSTNSCTLFLWPFSMSDSHLYLLLLSSLFRSGFRSEFDTHSSGFSWVLHCPPFSFSSTFSL
jgi:hypothetical protein